MPNNDGCTEVISRIAPANGADFKVVHWRDVDFEGFDGLGDKGADRLHLKFAETDHPDRAWLESSASDEPNTFVGVVVDKSDEAPTDPHRYCWTRFKGAGIASGSGKPALDGAVGDLYIDAESGTLSRFDQVKPGVLAWAEVGNVRGPKGEDGKPGEPGASPTLAVGALKVVASPDEAYAKNVGDEHAVVLELGLPGGRDGRTPEVRVGKTDTVEAGSPAKVTASTDASGVTLDFEVPRGADGKSLTVGDVTTETSAAGGDAEVYASEGEDGRVAFRFVVPQGPQGPQGEQGPQGPEGAKGDRGEQGERGERGERGENGLAATVAVGSVSKLAPGDAPTVTATQDLDTNAVTLDFGIPQGWTGPKGEQGIQGPQGEQGIQGPKGDNARIASVTVTMVPNGESASGSVTPGEDGDAVTLSIPWGDASETHYSGDASVAGSTGYESTAAALNDILRRLAALEPSIHIATLTADPDSVKKGTGGDVKLSWTYAEGSNEPATQEVSVNGVPESKAIGTSERSTTVTLDGSGDATITLKSTDANGKEDSRTVSVKAVDVQQQRVYFGLAPEGEVNEKLVTGLQFSELRIDPYIDETTVTLGNEADGVTPQFAYFACPKSMLTFNKVTGKAKLRFYCGGFQDDSFLENVSETPVGSTTYTVFRSGNYLAESEGQDMSLSVLKG